MVHPQRTCSHMELLPLVCLCLLSCSGTTSADPAERVVVEEGRDVILPCFFGVTIETEVLEWQKNGHTVLEYDGGIRKKLPDDRFSHFKEELKLGNASLKIKNAKVEDRGDYTCDILHNPSLKTVHVKLVVGAAPKPYITRPDETNDWALLQCEAHGVPDLEVKWQDSDGNKLPAEDPQVTERGGLSYITVNMTVTKTGRFTCVATQKNISHRISADTLVHFHEADVTGLIVGTLLVAAVVFGVVFGVVFYMREQKHKRELREKDRIIEGSRRDTERSDSPAENAALKSPA